jgi:hypothetical protein
VAGSEPRVKIVVLFFCSGWSWLGGCGSLYGLVGYVGSLGVWGVWPQFSQQPKDAAKQTSMTPSCSGACAWQRLRRTDVCADGCWSCEPTSWPVTGVHGCLLAVVIPIGCACACLCTATHGTLQVI